MKKTLLLLMLATPALFASAQNYKTPFMSKSLSGTSVKQVFVQTAGGSISVSGASGEDPRVEVYITGNNGRDNMSKEEIQKRLDENYTLTIDTHDGELHIEAKNKRNMNNWRNSLSIGFKVYVNRQTATNLTTAGGSIALNSLTGNQNFTTSGGSLAVNDLEGNIKGSTSGGSVSVKNSRRNIELTTSGGSIAAENCEGNIDLSTSGGSLRLANLKGTIDASTSGGSISGDRVNGDLKVGTSGGSVNLTAISGSLDASTSAGSIHAQMLSVGKFVKINASSGHVNVQLPANQGVDLDARGDRVTLASNGKFEGEKEKERVVGKVNGGGSRVDVRGDGINITF